MCTRLWELCADIKTSKLGRLLWTAWISLFQNIDLMLKLPAFVFTFMSYNLKLQSMCTHLLNYRIYLLPANARIISLFMQWKIKITSHKLKSELLASIVWAVFSVRLWNDLSMTSECSLLVGRSCCRNAAEEKHLHVHHMDDKLIWMCTAWALENMHNYTIYRVSAALLSKRTFTTLSAH